MRSIAKTIEIPLNTLISIETIVKDDMMYTVDVEYSTLEDGADHHRALCPALQGALRLMCNTPIIDGLHHWSIRYRHRVQQFYFEYHNESSLTGKSSVTFTIGQLRSHEDFDEVVTEFKQMFHLTDEEFLKGRK